MDLNEQGKLHSFDDIWFFGMKLLSSLLGGQYYLHCVFGVHLGTDQIE